MARLRLVVLSLVLGACGSIDPAVPMRLPDNDWAIGVSGAIVWDERVAPDQGAGLGGVDVSWLDGVWGLHAGVRAFPEGTRVRVGGLVEATAWYGLMLGLGTRVAWATTGDVGPAVDLTMLVALPIPILRDCAEHGWSIVVAPYARPGFRLTGGDRDPDDVRGFHELGVTLRFTSYGF